MFGRNDPGALAPTFDAPAFLRTFEDQGGRVYSDGRSFAIIYPPDPEVIPAALIDWGAVIAQAHDRAIYGA